MMELTHPQATWKLLYDDGAAAGPCSLETQGAVLFQDMQCRVDGTDDARLSQTKARHFHKGGCAVFEGSGEFARGIPVGVRQTQRVAANTLRVTYDIKWPKATALKEGLELGSAKFPGEWRRYLAVTSENASDAQWKELPQDLKSAPLRLSPIPEVLVLEDVQGRRLEWGLGDDLWRWNKGLNGEFLHAKGELRLEALSQGGLFLRRFVALCDPEEEARFAKLLENDPRFLPPAPAEDAEADAAEASGEPGAAPAVQAPEIPVSQPEARVYRFSAYLAWSEPALISQVTAESPVVLPVSENGLDGKALSGLCEKGAPCVALDLAGFPLPVQGRRDGDKNASACWESRPFQNLFRRCVRQLAQSSEGGVLVLRGVAPGWCVTAAHETRKSQALHWDLPAILETIAWARQALPAAWVIRVPMEGIWKELPSLSALGAASGFRNGEEALS